MKYAPGKEFEWLKSREVNSDPYGKAVLDYAERWADMMETHISSGKILTTGDIERMSHAADTEGITGFMYGAAVSLLAAVWVHGEQLRRWHNLDCQISDEGVRANDNGDILSPAMLQIS